MEKTNRIWFLIAHSLSNEISAQEQAELNHLLSDDLLLQQQYELLKRLWNHHHEPEPEEPVSDEERENVARILQIAKKKQSEDEPIPEEEDTISYSRLRRRRRFKRAGLSILTLSVVIVIFFWNRDGGVKHKTNAAIIASQTIAAQKGSRTRSILPDGSVVWVNAGSSISFEGDFTGKLREVKLEGEAYFDVVKNPKKPFIVHTGGIDIKVLGTAFNVKSYPTDKTVETTLIHGLVEVTRESDPVHKPIFLHPNEKLTLAKFAADNNKLLSNNNTSPANSPTTNYAITHLDTTIESKEYIETAWLYNRLAFRGDNFETLADKLERWYNINVTFEDEKVKKLNFNGSFENETVEQAFDALKAAVPFNFKIHAHEVSVSSQK